MAQRNIVLEKTVELMLSQDYKERFLAEYKQLVNRRNNLKKFIKKLENKEVKADCPIELLKKQLDVMNQYVEILKERSKIEKIPLK